MTNNTEKKYRRALTNSGDFYSATEYLWKQYWAAIERDDWDFIMSLETGKNKDFFYDP